MSAIYNTFFAWMPGILRAVILGILAIVVIILVARIIKIILDAIPFL